MPTKAPKRRASELAAAENLQPSDEEVQRQHRVVQEFIEPIARIAIDLRLFDYTDEQWADIERSLLHLKPDQAALERARDELVQAARLHNWELVDDALGRRTIEKWVAQEWARIDRLSDDLLRSLTRVARFEEQPVVEPYNDEQL